MSADPDFAELQVGDYLPRSREAVVPLEKLRDYSLNPDHPDGGPKARVLASLLGFRRDDWRALRDELLRSLPGARIVRVNRGSHEDTYGTTLTIRGLNGREAQVIAAWKLEKGAPRLVSVYVDMDALKG